MKISKGQRDYLIALCSGRRPSGRWVMFRPSAALRDYRASLRRHVLSRLPFAPTASPPPMAGR